MAEHSPLPWRQAKTNLGHPFNAKGMILDDANGHYVCRLFHPESPIVGTTSNCGTRTECEANAAYIVTAANAFPELVAALKVAIETIHAFHGDGEEWAIYVAYSPEMKTICTALQNAGVTNATH